MYGRKAEGARPFAKILQKSVMMAKPGFSPSSPTTCRTKSGLVPEGPAPSPRLKEVMDLATTLSDSTLASGAGGLEDWACEAGGGTNFAAIRLNVSSVSGASPLPVSLSMALPGMPCWA